jgi:hypothetical protein
MRAYGGPIPKESHYYRLSDVEQCIDLGLLSGLIEKLGVRKLSGEDAANVMLWSGEHEAKRTSTSGRLISGELSEMGRVARHLLRRGGDAFGSWSTGPERPDKVQ